ncbi:hypothetical protein BC940DRAFT_294747 [Gongronella butleri]|nr:hypothetical protein BC940DRAFT_294747 [Gongronella butleri]
MDTMTLPDAPGATGSNKRKRHGGYDGGKKRGAKDADEATAVAATACVVPGTAPRPLHLSLWAAPPAIQKPTERPQVYYLYLALRCRANVHLPRAQLISSALAIDREYSKLKNVPLAYNGKTPRNSASAILTTNRTRYFDETRQDDTSFYRLAFPLRDVHRAREHYLHWTRVIIERDWPLFFDTSDEVVYVDIVSTEATGGTEISPSTSPSPQQQQLVQSSSDDDQGDVFDDTNASWSSPPPPSATHGAPPTPKIVPHGRFTPQLPSPPYRTEFDDYMARHLKQQQQQQQQQQPMTRGTAPPPLSPPTPRNVAVKTKMPALDAFQWWDWHGGVCQTMDRLPVPGTRLVMRHGEPLPTQWQDLLEMAELDRIEPCTETHASNNSNNSSSSSAKHHATRRKVCTARRALPKGLPLGLYLGVPTSAMEFEMMRPYDHVKHFALQYGHGIIHDAAVCGDKMSDDIVTEPSHPLFCPLHFVRHTTTPVDANIAFLMGPLPYQIVAWTTRNIQPGDILAVHLTC